MEPTAYQPGSDADFERLCQDSYARVFRTLVATLGDRTAAEDCVQETFARAYKAWGRWSPDAPAEAWLHRIALNVATSYRRREHLRTLPQLLLRLGRPREEGFEAESRGELFEALRRLPPSQAQLIVLRYHHGYSNRELAAALGVPETTLGSRLGVARKALESELQRLGVVTDRPSRVVKGEE
ncbi:MAG TPA: RNA polymerase sigma factor [Candidatus Dormibacteraeota bacterium]